MALDLLNRRQEQLNVHLDQTNTRRGNFSTFLTNQERGNAMVQSERSCRCVLIHELQEVENYEVLAKGKALTTHVRSAQRWKSRHGVVRVETYMTLSLISEHFYNLQGFFLNKTCVT